MKCWFNVESALVTAMITVFGTIFLIIIVSLGLLLYIEFSTAKLNSETNAQVATPAQPPVVKEGSCGSN